ncbi:MAG: class I adenylate-forming enzyme family protein [Myxococcota bacterium]
MQLSLEDAKLTLGALLRRTALRVPDRVAIIWEQQKLTWRQLDEQVNRVAHGLIAAGIQPGEPVGLLINKRPELVIMFLACARMGAIATPINFKLTHDRIRYQFEHISMKAALIEKEHQPIYEAVKDLMPDPQRAIFLTPPAGADVHADFNVWEKLLQHSPDDPAHQAKPEDTVYLNYTSGSTGRPKGAITSHANIIWNCLSNLATFLMYEDDVFLGMFSTFSHPHELFHRAICLGCTAVLVDSLNPRIIGRAIQEHRVTWMMGVPTFYEMLFQQAEHGHLDLSSLRVLEAGGAFIDAQTLTDMESRFNTTLMPVWGSTETTGVGLALVKGPERKAGTIGKPCAFYEFRVVNDEGQDVGVDEVGEMLVKGPAVVSGYLNAPEETARLFRDGWYHTQDLVQRDADGYFKFVGRRSEMLKIGGIRVYPSEIELAIKGHDEVHAVVVVGAYDKVRGEQARAVVVRRPGSALTEKALRVHCRQTLAVYQMPRIIEFWEQLPQLPNGKIDKKAVSSTPLPPGHD